MRIHCLTGLYIDVEGDTLVGAKLSGLDLHRAMLAHVVLRGANLSGADLRSADLSGAMMRCLVCPGADFSTAKFDGANVGMAQMKGAIFDGADLRKVLELDAADVTDASANALTKWPPGFDPTNHGIRIR